MENKTKVLLFSLVIVLAISIFILSPQMTNDECKIDKRLFYFKMEECISFSSSTYEECEGKIARFICNFEEDIKRDVEINKAIQEKYELKL